MGSVLCIHVRMRICTPPVIVVYRLQCGHTALQRAAGGGHLEIVKLLLSHGATVDHQDEVVSSSFITQNCAMPTYSKYFSTGIPIINVLKTPMS